MRNLFSLLLFAAIVSNVRAQAPEKFSYQAVIRDANDQLISNQTIGMRLTILEGGINGASVYSESQTTMTNDNGLVSIEIGDGNVISGDISSIDWASGPYFLKRQIDPLGGTNYTISGTSEMLSVPYALYANEADTAAFAMRTMKNVNGTYMPLYQWVGQVNGNNPATLATTDGTWFGGRTIMMTGYVYIQFNFPQAALDEGLGTGTSDLEMYLRYDGQTVFPIMLRNIRVADGARITLPFHWLIENSTAGSAKQFSLYGAQNKSITDSYVPPLPEPQVGPFSIYVDVTVVFSWVEL